MSEIHSSASFEYVDERHLRFSGQLKTKGRAGGDESFIIPVLTDSGDVLKAMEWLNKNEKRTNDAAKSHNRYSKELSGEVKEWGKHIEVIKGSFTADKLTYHKLRQLYALKATELFCPAEIYPTTFKANILGHGEKDEFTAVRYESDFKLA